MNRLHRIIQCFNDYDDIIKNIISLEGQRNLILYDEYGKEKLNDIRERTSILIGELRRYGCRKEREETK